MKLAFPLRNSNDDVFYTDWDPSPRAKIWPSDRKKPRQHRSQHIAGVEDRDVIFFWGGDGFGAIIPEEYQE